MSIKETVDRMFEHQYGLVQGPLDDEENTCQNPCDPNSDCEKCADYWQRMSDEGMWDKQKHRWTDKGWDEIFRHL